MDGRTVKTPIGTIHDPKLFMKWVILVMASVFLWIQLRKALIKKK